MGEDIEDETINNDEEENDVEDESDYIQDYYEDDASNPN